MKEKPFFCTDEHLTFLDDLRESGATNMLGATPYLQEEFSELTETEARHILGYWMDSFSERHKKEEKS